MVYIKHIAGKIPLLRILRECFLWKLVIGCIFLLACCISVVCVKCCMCYVSNFRLKLDFQIDADFCDFVLSCLGKHRICFTCVFIVDLSAV